MPQSFRVVATALVLFPVLAADARGQQLLEVDGIELRGEAQLVLSGGGTCNVLASDTGYEAKKENHGAPMDVWRLDFSVRNGSGRWLDHLIARFQIESAWPDCTNWDEPDAGTFAQAIAWADSIGNIQESGRNVVSPGQTLTETRLFIVLRGDQAPRFSNWSLDFDFAAAPRAAGAGSPAAASAQQPTPAGSDVRPRPGEAFRDCDGCPEMVVIPAGRFQMGCVSGRECLDDEQPVHAVAIARPFGLSKYEVTFEEYDRFAVATGRSGPSDNDWGRGRRPVVNVSWQDAQEYVAWLSSQAGAWYRLPSEAEWEYAARAGTTTAYSWGNEVGNNRANCDGCGSQWDNMTAPVGSFGANAWGLHDMHGNVSEWTEDCWYSSYAGAPADGSAWTVVGDCGRRVWRGGSFFPYPRVLRAANRGRLGAGVRTVDDVGFRVARTFD